MALAKRLVLAAMGILLVAQFLPAPALKTVKATTCATPSINSVYPNWGGVYIVPEIVTITGCGFTSATSVDFHGGFPLAGFTIVDDSTITAQAPPVGYAPGSTRQGLQAVGDITVTTPAGTSTTTVADQFSWFWGGTPCSTASLSAAYGAGSSIVLTGKTFSCVNPEYRFWIRPPGGAWRIVQDYTPATNMVGTYAWNLLAGARGTYFLEVDVRDQGHTSVPYEKVANMTYTVGGCVSAALSTSPPSPSDPGASVTLTGAAGCSGTPTFRFWIRPPAGAWKIVQDYSTTSTFAWNTTGLQLGTYYLEVDVRNQGSTQTYEQVSNATYRVGVPCTTPSLIVLPNPGPTGGGETATASTSGCSSPVYRFWTSWSNHRWIMIRDYAGSNTVVWTTPGTGLAGEYRVEVDVRSAGDTVAYDAVYIYTVTLAPCSAATLGASPSSPQPHRTPITLTGGATCTGTATYRFWVRSSGGAWSIVSDYSTSNSFAWTPAGAGTYYLEVDVRNQGATATYETVSNITYTVS